MLDKLKMFLPHSVPVNEKAANRQQNQRQHSENSYGVVIEQIFRRDCNFGLLVLVDEVANPVAVNVVDFLVENLPEQGILLVVNANAYRFGINGLARRLQRIGIRLVHERSHGVPVHVGNVRAPFAYGYQRFVERRHVQTLFLRITRLDESFRVEHIFDAGDDWFRGRVVEIISARNRHVIRRQIGLRGAQIQRLRPAVIANKVNDEIDIAVFNQLVRVAERLRKLVRIVAGIGIDQLNFNAQIARNAVDNFRHDADNFAVAVTVHVGFLPHQYSCPKFFPFSEKFLFVAAENQRETVVVQIFIVEPVTNIRLI